MIHGVPDSLLIEPARLWSGDSFPDGPIAFVDLDAACDYPSQPTLPPYPLIGVGNPEHPLATHLDAVIEPPIVAPRLIAQVTASPLAAAAIVQLQRVLPALAHEAGLIVESMAYAMLQGSAEHARWLAGRSSSARVSEAGSIRASRKSTRLVVTLARPFAGNAIDRTMRDSLAEALALAAIDPEITSVVLRGQGKAFSLGAELSEFGTTTDPATTHAIRARTLPAHMALRCADKLEAQVQGACIGAGLELAAFARRITATADAWFQLPELAMGILPGAGGCVSLTRRIGRQRTNLLILSGQRLSARRALDWGLIDALVDQPA